MALEPWRHVFNLSNPGCQGAGEGLTLARRRTFARGILPLTLSDADGAPASSLRLSAYAGSRGVDRSSPSFMVPASHSGRLDRSVRKKRRGLTLTRSSRRFREGLPVSSSGLWKRAEQGLRSAASTAVSGGQDARSERPARGHGHPEPRHCVSQRASPPMRPQPGRSRRLPRPAAHRRRRRRRRPPARSALRGRAAAAP